MRMTRITIYSLLALLVGVAIMWLTSSSGMLGIFTQAVIYAIFALGVGVLLKQNGLVSFGHALYFGGAGYGIGVLLQLQWMPAEWALLAVLVAMGLAAFLIGLVIVRVPGIAFGMLTAPSTYTLLSIRRGINSESPDSRRVSSSASPLIKRLWKLTLIIFPFLSRYDFFKSAVFTSPIVQRSCNSVVLRERS